MHSSIKNIYIFFFLLKTSLIKMVAFCFKVSIRVEFYRIELANTQNSVFANDVKTLRMIIGLHISFNCNHIDKRIAISSDQSIS